MDVSNTAVVGIRPRSKLLRGQLPAADFQQVAAWITLNETVLLDFRNGKIDTIELGALLQNPAAADLGC